MKCCQLKNIPSKDYCFQTFKQYSYLSFLSSFRYQISSLNFETLGLLFFMKMHQYHYYFHIFIFSVFHACYYFLAYTLVFPFQGEDQLLCKYPWLINIKKHTHKELGLLSLGDILILNLALFPSLSKRKKIMVVVVMMMRTYCHLAFCFAQQHTHWHGSILAHKLPPLPPAKHRNMKLKCKTHYIKK